MRVFILLVIFSILLLGKSLFGEDISEEYQDSLDPTSERYNWNQNNSTDYEPTEKPVYEYREKTRTTEERLELEKKNSYWGQFKLDLPNERSTEKIDINTSVEVVGTKTATDWYQEGLAYSDKKDYEKSLECYNKALILDPNFDVYQQRGEAYYRLGKYREAVIDLTKAISANPSGAWCYYYRGLSYKSIGEIEKAKKDLKKGCEELRNPDSCGAYEALK